MKICSKCSAPINENSKFCPECGEKCAPQAGERVQEFSGKITKCPNCGEVLKALSVKCPACGFELREVEVTGSVKEFSEKLAKTIPVNQKVSLIRNFPIPNAKADIFEFMILATSNFDTEKYLKATGTEKQMSEAWLDKIEQCYSKAEALFKTDRDFEKIKAIYDSDIKELKEAKASKAKAKASGKHYFFGTLMMLMAAMIFLMIMLKGSGILANPRLDVTVIGFLANGIISYIYASKKEIKLIAMIVYGCNALLNVVCCFFAPGHVFHVLIIVACGLGAFLDKKKE